MRVRGLPVREGGVRLPQDCAAREGAVRRAVRDCAAHEGALWARVDACAGVPVREGYGRMGGGWIWKRSRFWCW